jgi:hypothetical protein
MQEIGSYYRFVVLAVIPTDLRSNSH